MNSAIFQIIRYFHSTHINTLHYIETILRDKVAIHIHTLANISYPIHLIKTQTISLITKHLT